MNAEDIPEEVRRVWVYQYCGHAVGIDTWNEINAVIKAYPEYFPWETKYNSIPQSVHDAYNKEKYAWMDKLYQKPHPEGYIGLIPTIMQMDEVLKEAPPEPQMTIHEIFIMLSKQEDDKRKRQQEQDENNKALWDKHYKTYGLEYRK